MVFMTICLHFLYLRVYHILEHKNMMSKIITQKFSFQLLVHKYIYIYVWPAVWVFSLIWCISSRPFLVSSTTFLLCELLRVENYLTFVLWPAHV